MRLNYTFHLTDGERDLLRGVIKRLAGTSLKVRRVQMMLKADASGPRWADAQIAETFFCPIKTVARTRQRVVESGVEATLANQKEGASGHNRLLSGDQEARIIAERLGKPPAGYANWSLRLLTEQVVELQVVDLISYETICGVLKKPDDQSARCLLGHSSREKCGICRTYEGGPGRVRPAIRLRASRRLHG